MEIKLTNAHLLIGRGRERLNMGCDLVEAR